MIWGGVDFGPSDYNALCFGRTSFWVLFFGVFHYLKNDQRELLQLNSLAVLLIKNYKSKCNYSWEGRKGHFWCLHYFLEGTQWTAPCGSGVPGILPGAAHGFRVSTGLISPPAVRPGKVGRVKCFEPCWWGGLPGRLYMGSPSQVTGMGKLGHPCALQFSTTPRGGKDQAVPITTFWTSAGRGIAPAPRILGSLS